jgi:hypothetical protein
MKPLCSRRFHSPSSRRKKMASHINALFLGTGSTRKVFVALIWFFLCQF